MLAGSSVAAATTLTLIYAKYDKNFREQLSTYLPFINSLLSEEQKLVEATRFDDSFMKKKPSKPVDTKMFEENPLPQVPIVAPVVTEAKPPKADPEPAKDLLDEKAIKKDIAMTFEKAINDENVIVSVFLIFKM